jgi:DNA-binding LacI/PurR family transcriptional regulator
VKDVAHHVGTSTTTISNAFHHPERLSPGLRERILETAERLGYRADPTARGLRLQSTGAIGVLYTESLPFAFSDPAFSVFLRGVAEVLEAEGRTLQLLSGAPSLPGAQDALGNAAVDGAIWYGPVERDPRLRGLTHRRPPVVLVDADPVEGLVTVDVDDEVGAAAIAHHLFGLGHREVALVVMRGARGAPPSRVDPGTLHRSESRVIRARAAGYASAARRHRVAWSSLATWAAHSQFEEGRSVGLDILRAPQRPTAILCMSDQLALGVLAAAREVGVEVPRELSVVGFDGVPESARSAPPLTTVTQDHSTKGRLAAEALLAILKGGPGGPTRHVRTVLTLRGSTAPPRR